MEPLSYNRLASALCNCLIRSTAVDTIIARNEPSISLGLTSARIQSCCRYLRHRTKLSIESYFPNPYLTYGMILILPFSHVAGSTSRFHPGCFLLALISLSTSTLSSLFTTCYSQLADSYVAFGHRTPSDC